MNIRVAAVLAALAGFGVLVCAQGIPLNIITTEVNGRLADNINLPFVNDPAVLGEWVSVDFVREPADFQPGIKRFRDPLYLEGILFRPNGWMTGHTSSWTKGVVLDKADLTASRYIIKEIAGATYMFLEWKSGDYTIRRQKPEYYVLKKK